MKSKRMLIKSIALILVLFTAFTTLLSCAADNSAEGESSGSGSDSGNESSNEQLGFEYDISDDGEANTAGLTIFANGQYAAGVIRSETADSFSKDVYTDIRALFKKKLGDSPAIATDFVANGASKPNGPAILVGDTSYSESKSVYATLKDNEAKAVIKGDKYVLVWKTEAAGVTLLEKFTALFNKEATKDSVVITSKWNITVATTEKTFDESALQNTATLPDLSEAGGSWKTKARDAGHGSKIYISGSANAGIYTKYLTALEKAGYTFYTKNETLHTNKFATYVTKDQIVNVMFFEPKGVIKVVVDPRSTFGLPGLASENSYTKTNTATEFVQLGLKQISGSSENGMGYVVKLTDGRFVVVDAGFAYDTGGGGNSGKFIVDTLKKMQGNTKKPVIAAYIITHIHTDHAGGFMGLANACASQVTIEKLIYNQPSNKQMDSVSNMSSRKNWIPDAISKLQKAGSLKSVVKAHPGQQFFLCDLTITILGSIDVIEDNNYTKMANGNNSSVVSMFEMNGGKVLLCGDAEPLEGKAIRDIYGGIGNKNSPLKADFIQVAHHGYGNTNTDYKSGNDQNALNVMASGGGTAAGSSPIYALVPVGLANGKDPAGYYDAVKRMGAMKIFAEDHRLVAYNKNMTIKFNKDGTQTIDKVKHDGFWIGTWTTY